MAFCQNRTELKLVFQFLQLGPEKSMTDSKTSESALKQLKSRIPLLRISLNEPIEDKEQFSSVCNTKKKNLPEFET